MSEAIKPYFVILTGSKNNAGDFLIKYRAKKLFNALRTDRDVVDIDSWKPFTEEQLKIVNGAKALILMGGPSVQNNMYPGVYPMVKDLDRIEVPITTMGIGWKGIDGNWDETRHYPLSDKTLSLLERINHDNLTLSVRDYHTLNVLTNRGLHNICMTGCPATYSLEHMGHEFNSKVEVKKIGFSLGVSFLHSEKMKNQMKTLMLEIKERYKDASFIVAFHHSLEKNKLDLQNKQTNHLEKHQELAEWLENNDISYCDISGSAQSLIDFYSRCDVHVGYRVHAHIFMTSISKPSILIAEDGRGKALLNVFGSIVLNGYEGLRHKGFFGKAMTKLGVFDRYKVSKKVPGEVLNLLSYEIKNDYANARNARSSVNNNFIMMEKFIKNLP